MSGRILAQLMDTVRNALKESVEIVESRLWLDSKTALCWINNQGEWKQFVRHRVNEILRLSRKNEWGHCPGKENPADIGSRGVLATELKESMLWWKGPTWLVGPREEWPKKGLIVETPESVEEVKKSSVLVVQEVHVKVSNVSCVVDINRYSKLDKLLRVTSLVVRFIFNLRARVKEVLKRSGEVEKGEIVEAENLWIQAVQIDLKSASNFETLVKDLGIVSDGAIMKCKGRLGNSKLDAAVKEPVILPKDHRFTVLVIESCHERVHHGGIRGTLAELRARFWVPKGRQGVKKVLGKCVVCRKTQGKSCGVPPMAALPDFRVRVVPPFSKVGVDFAGPLFVKGVSGEWKRSTLLCFLVALQGLSI